ncbi:MAG TPA: hypothetical protein VGL25_00320 [Casimicrobiaceae bacterium]
MVTEQLQPKVDGDNIAFNLIARFDGFTATRIRNRGVWMRGPWFVFDNARAATSREAITMVTAGGLDGSSPAFWGLLKNSVVVGLSKNNVDRWGPCPEPTAQEGPGCVDRNTEAADLFEKSYPSPAWNFAGFYIYDGPVRIHDTRFVNFRHDITPLLTVTDAAFLQSFKSYYSASVYEGDAALGWFQNNQSAYPTTTEVRGLTFEGTNLRHQVFTDKVNFGNFDDGDKNTAVIDRDGSLTGYRVVDASGLQAKHRHAVSLNNLPFNAVANAADECASTGAQDAAAEDRPTSLISPGDLATLEFGALLPPDGVVTAATGSDPNMTQLMTFTQDVKNRFDKHASMTLHSRNNQGIWEPKIHGGRGYTVSVASAAASNPGQAGPVGMPRYTNIGLTDVVKPDIASKPFSARIGVCYTNVGGTHPPAEFAILRGFKSWGGNAVNYNDPTLRKSFNRLVNLYNGQTCHNLDSQSNRVRTPGQDNTDPMKGCPADGVLPLESAASCTAAGGKPARSRADLPQDDACIFETRALKKAENLAELTDPVSGAPVDLYKYYYDAKSGMLSFYVVQDIPNAQAASPHGSCRGRPDDDPACPNPADPIYPESYYGCPAQGCITYTVRIVGGDYTPGASACGDDGDPSRMTDATAIYRYKRDEQGRGIYELDPPKDEFQLAYVPSPSSPHEAVRRGDRVDPMPTVSSKGFDHVKAKYAPYCAGQPPTPGGGRTGE